jgi:tetratricopeptide (TPR) repeat protein
MGTQVIPRRFVLAASGCLGTIALAGAAEVAPMPRLVDSPIEGGVPQRGSPKAPIPRKDGMALTGLSPAKVFPDLCKYRYRVSTPSEQCQVYCDQALGFYYSYVWIEAARSFETALKHDPECAFAWLGLYRAMDKWGGGTKLPVPTPFLAVSGGLGQGKLPDRFAKPAKEYALEQARLLMPKANHREQLLVTAKLQEKGMWPNVPPEERKKKATATLDELLTLYEDDEEGWFARAQVAEGPNSSVPFYKALLKVNPVNPAANHELVHHYENIRRPALGWANAEKYIESSPGIPHAFHMQAHLGTRIGKWGQTSDWSSRAIELQLAYHKYQDVRPSEDHQFTHHLEILTKSLVHDGRFAEALKIKKVAQENNYSFKPEWFRLAFGQQDWVETGKMIEAMRKTDKAGAAYYGALVALEKGDTKRAQAELDILREAGATKGGSPSGRGAKNNEYRLWEVQGRLMCQQGNGEGGCKLFRRIIEKTKDDFGHHAWGGGAYYMEAWGTAALEGGIAREAEEGFTEALAHDAGSVRGALGMWALCDRLGRSDEASRYLKLAERCWAKADRKDYDTMKNAMAKRAEKVPLPGGEKVSLEGER